MEIKWIKQTHWSLSKWYVSQYKDENSEVYKEEFVHRDSNGFPTDKTKTNYYAGQSKKVFKTFDDAFKQLNHGK